MTDTTNLQDLKALLKWANLSDDIQELQIKYGDIELAMSRTPGGLDRPAPAPAPAAAPAAAPSASPAEQAPVQQAPAQADRHRSYGRYLLCFPEAGRGPIRQSWR